MQRLKRILFIAIVSGASVFAQQAKIDWKVTRTNQVRQVLTNVGDFFNGHRAEINYPGLLNCEYPLNSFEEHIGDAGIWVGGITPDGDTLVTTTSSWASSPYWETYPSTAEWDSIWVVQRGDTVDIPYWPGYIGVSDEDFIMRYNDYNELSLRDQRHTPLYLEFIQRTYTYSNPPGLNEVIINNYMVMPTKFDVREVYISLWMDANIGSISYGANFMDDISLYFPDLKMAVGDDSESGTDGAAISPIGIMAIPPKEVDADDLRWTWKWGSDPFAPGMIPPKDSDKYRELMADGIVMENQVLASGSHFVLSFGPFDIAVGDTLRFSAAEVFGEGLEGVLKNAEALQFLIDQDFRVPSAPPAPPLQVETSNKTITLSWSPTADSNPELFQDPNRVDGIAQPFEGYRIYKSTKSATGPWTLIAEFDIADNNFGNDLGLKYHYTEGLLLNNVEYYYSVTSFSKPDTVLNWPSLESSVNTNAKVVVPGTAPPDGVGQVAVVPNPYRGDIAYSEYNPPWERPDPSRERWLEQDRRIQFINLPEECEIKIYTVAGDLVQTLIHRDPTRGYEDWNLTSSVGQAIASDIYLFTVQDFHTGKVQVGRFVVIK